MAARRTTRAVVCVAGAIAVLAACGSDTRPSDTTWRSTHFRYHTRATDDSVCEGVTTTLEAHFDTLRAVLDTPWPEGAVTEYYKYFDSADLATNGTCSPGNESCYLGAPGIETSQPMEQHELVHALLSYLGDSHPALEEGIAEALSCGHRRRSVPTVTDWKRVFSSAAWRAAQANGEGLRPLYDAASWFVGYLLHTETASEFVSFYASLRPSDEASSVEAAFEAVYEAPLAATWSAALEVTEPEIACLRLWECAATDWFAEPLTGWNQACDQSDRVRSLELTEPSLITQVSPGAGLRLASCDPLTPVPQDAQIDALIGGNRGERFLATVPAGRYFVAASPYLDGPAQISAEPLSGKLGHDDTCEALTPFRPEIGEEVQFAFDRRAVADAIGEPSASLDGLVLRVALPEPSTGAFFSTCSVGTSLRVCTGCDPDACTSFCGDGADIAQLPAEFTLRVDADDAVSAWVKFARVD